MLLDLSENYFFSKWHITRFYKHAVMQVPDTKRGKRMKVKGCMSIERAKETEVKGHMSA
jgi:hypothetical protein